MQSQARQQIHNLCGYLQANDSKLVIDADAHITDLNLHPRRQTQHYYHGRPISAEDLIAEMDQSAIDMANTWQNPASTPYCESCDDNYNSLLEANRYIHRSALLYPQRLIPSGWTDPKACGLDNARRIVDQCVLEFGFLIVKMNPAQNQYPIDSPPVLELVDHIISLGAIPAFHYGADSPYTPAAGLEAIACRHPNHPILAIHMGGGGAGYLEAETLYHQSRELGLRQPNIHYALSALRETHIESSLCAYQAHGPDARRRLFCASDAPYGRISWNFGGFRAMFKTLPFDENSIRGYLGQNFARFLLNGYQHLLAIQA